MPEQRTHINLFPKLPTVESADKTFDKKAETLPFHDKSGRSSVSTICYSGHTGYSPESHGPLLFQMGFRCVE